MRTQAHIKFAVLTDEEGQLTLNEVEAPWLEIVIGGFETDAYLRHTEYGPEYIGDVKKDLTQHIFSVRDMLAQLQSDYDSAGEEFDLFEAEHRVNHMIIQSYPELQALVDRFVDFESDQIEQMLAFNNKKLLN